jgi:hypothetical protein
MLRARDLKNLPFTTLSQLAIALARDIDNGDDDKREALALIWKFIPGSK